MSAQTKRFFVSSSQGETESIRLGFGLVSHLIKNPDGGIRDIVLLIPTKRQLQGTTLVDAIGTRIAKALYDNKVVNFGNAKLRLETIRTVNHLLSCDILLCIYAGSKVLAIADGLLSAKAIIVVPGTMKDQAKSWIKTWGPVLVSEKGVEQSEPTKVIGDTKLEVALEFLTSRVNLSTGLGHPNDKDAAVALFRLLYGKGLRWNPQSIYEWALRNRWTPDAANELKEVADAILNRKRIRGPKHSVWAEDILDKIAAEAAKRS